MKHLSSEPRTHISLIKLQTSVFIVSLMFIAAAAYHTPKTLPGPEMGIILMGFIYIGFVFSTIYFNRILGKIGLVLTGGFITLTHVLALLREKPPCGEGAIGLIANTPCAGLNIPLIKAEVAVAALFAFAGMTLSYAIIRRCSSR